MATIPLSEHFLLHEFGAVPDNCIPIYALLCSQLLEPIRAHVGDSILITSGYRTPEQNAAANGVHNSQHCATPEGCAADFVTPKPIEVFNWIRLQSGLIWDQLILELNDSGPPDNPRQHIIHISVTARENRRMAMKGRTFNQTPFYLHLPVGIASA